MTKTKTGPRDRKDHLLPRGYLNGFTKNGQLSVYDMVGKSWSENKPSEVGYIKGFFDYCPNSDPDQTADESFQFFENNFSQLRKQFVASKFSGWKDHLEFFLEYAQMLRVRTELFRKETPRTCTWHSASLIPQPLRFARFSTIFLWLIVEDGDTIL